MGGRPGGIKAMMQKEIVTNEEVKSGRKRWD